MSKIGSKYSRFSTRYNRGFYCRSYCLLNMFGAPLCPSSGAQEYYIVVAACRIWLDTTEVFIADLIACSTCFGHHYAHHQELKNIILWLLPVVFHAVVMCPAPHQTSNLKTTARNTTDSNHSIILLSS